MTWSVGEDLETEILVRLPAKSLMRFRCVQQSWKALFKTYTFVTRHMNTRSIMQKRFMTLHYRPPPGLEPCITVFPSNTDPFQRFEPPFKDLFPRSKTLIYSYNYCNGVLCLRVSNGLSRWFIFWNPCTREVKLSPEPFNHAALWGFGVDPNTNHFKLVRIFRDLPAELYNPNTNFWTLLDDQTPLASFTTGFGYSKQNAFVNGVFHWLIQCDNPFAIILCFSFRDKHFSELKGPIPIFDSDAFHNIAEVDGSIAYVVRSRNPVRFEIWVMDQHHWTKKYNIGPFDPSFRIYCIGTDGTKVLGRKEDQNLMLYDFDARPLHQFQFDGFFSFSFVHNHAPIQKFVESVASLYV
ncbi:hypothetical protein VNO77_42027 [Canavalia gladiata]|uniref:F-box associated beta-propeller type 1 domain-containing protein n=1 Tax=Canavalia gladiata TaxID=3824 RepID=A0AAN9K2J2_CANGL